MNLRTIYKVLDEAADKYGDMPAMYQPIAAKGVPKYQMYTWTEYRRIAQEVACGLRSLGIGKGDIVALDSESRAEFYLADQGVIANGSIAAALYTSLPPAELVRNIFESDAKAVFVEDAATMQALREAGAPVDPLLWILLTGEAEGALTLQQLREHGRRAMLTDPQLFTRIQAAVTPDDYAVLYLTSGTTGEPKMGLVKNSAIVTNIDMGPEVLPITSSDVTLVFLPSAHIAQRVVLEMLPIRCGVPVYFSEGLNRMPAELKRIRPTFLLAPPRVWERIYANITAEIRKRPAVTRKLFYGVLGLGLKAAHLRHEGRPIPGWMTKAMQVADRLVFRQIRERLGGRLRVAASGAAPLGRELAHFFEAIGLPLVEGYGLSEGGVAALNPITNPRAGSIGKLLPGVQLRLAEDGELLLKSPALFSGYYKDPEATASVLRGGWLHTGDIAEVDKEGYIYITGRKKELIVSSNGKKIYPSRIEGLFKLEPVINQTIVLGDRQPYVTALFTVNLAAAETVKGMEEFKGKPAAELASAPALVEEVQRAVKRVNRQLAPFEQIKRFRIVERDFSLENGELTPTMKVRRKQVLENFRHHVADLYLGKEEMS
ncbi:MAG TPA: long-chain fatty acid--CoA ligase [Bryobacteraceae bacterium]|nr:long-chain fatty acid--CoA ligase [Bryobacteraceae bacterium]